MTVLKICDMGYMDYTWYRNVQNNIGTSNMDLKPKQQAGELQLPEQDLRVIE